jgi:hypothetical protein
MEAAVVAPIHVAVATLLSAAQPEPYMVSGAAGWRRECMVATALCGLPRVC